MPNPEAMCMAEMIGCDAITNCSIQVVNYIPAYSTQGAGFSEIQYIPSIY
jgi:hypothetical protein